MTPDEQRFFNKVGSGDISALQSMLDAGFDRQTRNSEGNTALHFALVQDKPDVALFLIRQGFDIHAAGKSEMTPLDMAFLFEAQDVAIALIRAGAKVDLADANYALCYASRKLPVLSAIWETLDGAQRKSEAQACLESGYADGVVHLCDKLGVDIGGCLREKPTAIEDMPEPEAKKIKAYLLQCELRAAQAQMMGGTTTSVPKLGKMRILKKGERL